jgi:hypothetical protein
MTTLAPKVTLDLDVTPEDKAFFDAHGYWLGPRLFEQHELDELAAAQDDVMHGRYETGRPPYDVYWKPGGDPETVRKHDDTHLANDVIRRFATHEGIGRIAAQLLGADTIRLWHDQSLFKPGSTGGKHVGNVAWHQDYNYWFCSDRPEMITAWIPMHDVDMSIGTMTFVDGSHRWGWHPAFSHGFNQDLAAQRSKIEAHMPRDARFEVKPCILEAGRVSFHHALTIHGSGPNYADRPRRSLVLHLQSGECRWSYGPDGHWHLCARQMESLSKHRGERFEGEFWPVLWSNHHG